MSATTRVTVFVPTGKKLPDGGMALVLATPQLSDWAGRLKVTTAPHCPGSFVCTMLAGTIALGGSTSLTVTLNVVLLALPQASVAIFVTMVVPTGKAEPDASTELTGTMRS